MTCLIIKPSNVESSVRIQVVFVEGFVEVLALDALH